MSSSNCAGQSHARFPVPMTLQENWIHPDTWAVSSLKWIVGTECLVIDSLFAQQSTIHNNHKNLLTRSCFVKELERLVPGDLFDFEFVWLRAKTWPDLLVIDFSTSISSSCSNVSAALLVLLLTFLAFEERVPSWRWPRFLLEDCILRVWQVCGEYGRYLAWLIRYPYTHTRWNEFVLHDISACHVVNLCTHYNESIHLFPRRTCDSKGCWTSGFFRSRTWRTWSLLNKRTQMIIMMMVCTHRAGRTVYVLWVLIGGKINRGMPPAFSQRPWSKCSLQDMFSHWAIPWTYVSPFFCISRWPWFVGTSLIRSSPHATRPAWFSCGSNTKGVGRLSSLMTDTRPWFASVGRMMAGWPSSVIR